MLRFLLLMASISCFVTTAEGAFYTAKATGLTTAGNFPGLAVIGLNNYGHAAGSQGGTAAFFDGEEVTNIGTLVISPGNPFTASVARSINDSGLITGSSFTTLSGGGTVRRAFFYDGSSLRDLGTLGGIESFGSDINNSGAIVGLAQHRNGLDHAFLYDGSRMIDIHNNAITSSHRLAASRAYSISDSGYITGIYGDPFFTRLPSKAFLYRDGVTELLPTLGGETVATDVNDLGQVTGWSANRAFLYRDGSMLPITEQPSFAYGLNNHGHIVGQFTGPTNRAFYFDGATAIDLSSSIVGLVPQTEVRLRSALSINDLGQIVAEGVIGSEVGAFLLTPTSEPLSVLDAGHFAVIAYPGRQLSIAGSDEVFPAVPEGFTLGQSVSCCGGTLIGINTINSWYRNDLTDQIVITTAGTDTVADWLGPNLSMGIGTDFSGAFADYVKSATDMLKSLQQTYPTAEITLTGHSLGGAIAQTLANASGLRAVTWNAPGAGGLIDDPKVIAALEGISLSAEPREIVNYRLYGDVISTIGTQLGATVSFAPPVSKALIRSLPVPYAVSMHDALNVISAFYFDAEALVVESSSWPRVVRENEEDYGPDYSDVIAGITVAPKLATEVAEEVSSRAVEASRDFIRDALIDLTVYTLEQAVELIVNEDQVLWVDPSGYSTYYFAPLEGGSGIRAILFPDLILADAKYYLEYRPSGAWEPLGIQNELDEFTFGDVGIKELRFTILNSADMNPLTGVEEFAFGVRFWETTTVGGTVIAYNVKSAAPVPLPSAGLLFPIGLALLAAFGKSGNPGKGNRCL